MSSDTDDAVPEPVEPTREELREAVGLVRTSGLTNPEKPLTEHQALVYVARRLSAQHGDAAKIKDVLSKAIEDDDVNTEAIRVLFGLTDALSGRAIGARRKQAMRLSGHDGGDPESFRKHIERDWLHAIASWLSFSLEVADRASVTDRLTDSPPHDDLRGPALLEPDPEPTRPPQVADAARSFPRRTPALLAVVVLAVIGIAVAVALDRGGNNASAVSGRCGSTTVQSVKDPQSEILVYAPNLGGWTFDIQIPPSEAEKSETFRYGEVRQFALDATNETSEAERDLIARIGLPRSATLEANTTCVYRNGDYASGTRYASTSLSAPSGLKIGSLAPHQWVYVTFKERLPTVGLTSNTATTYGAIAAASKIGGPEWTEKASHLELELTGGA